MYLRNNKDPQFKIGVLCHTKCAFESPRVNTELLHHAWNGIFARVLTLVPRSLLRNPRTPEKHLLRRLSGEHSLRRRLHLWLKTERTKHGMHYPHTGIIQSRQSIFIFHDLESHLLLDSASASVFKR